MDRPILYSYYRSSCSYRVRIALELSEVEYEYRAVHLVNNGGEQYSNEYKALNPKMEVPLLVHNETVISQSLAIISYLNDTWKKYELIPSDPKKRARALQLSEIIATGIQPLQNLSVLNFIKSEYNLSEEQKLSWGHYWISRGLDAFEAELQKNTTKFCLGDKPSIVDCFMVPQVYNAYRFQVDMKKYPKIDEIYNQCLEIPAFQKAAPDKQIDNPDN